jgi:hypothetical protein
MPWKTDSGLKEDFIFRVDSADFHVQEDMGGNLVLELGGTDLDDPEGYQPTIRYTCGPGWESADGGSATHFKGRERFNRSTKVGRLIDRVVEVLGPDAANALGEPTEAKTWCDIVMHIVAEPREYTFQGETGTTTDQLPTEVWRSMYEYEKSLTGGKQAPIVPVSEKVQSAKSKLAAKSAPEHLIALAKSHATIGEFQSAALEDDDVVADDELVERIMDESDSGFYSKYH